MCMGRKDGTASSNGATLGGECGNLCAQCRQRTADIYGAQLPYVTAPLIHPDVIGPDEEQFLRKQAALRRQIELAEGDLWLFD